jgi:hypothetical protein
MLKQNNATSVAPCAELADEFAAAGVPSAIAGIGPRRDAWQYDAGMTVAEACDGTQVPLMWAGLELAPHRRGGRRAYILPPA